MNSILRVASSLFVLMLAVGCASTEVSRQTKMAAEEKLARPGHIYVFPFAATPADIPPWSAAAGRYAQPNKQQTNEEIEIGRNLGAQAASELVARIRDMGLSAMEGNRQTIPQVNDILLIGYFESIQEGSAAKRLAFGFGSGAAEMKTIVEGYQMTARGLRQLGSGEVQSGGGKMPGAVVPLAVFAATANPVGLIVMGSAKVAGEVTGRSTIEGTAKRTAETIADQLQVRFREHGWIP